MKGDKCVAGGGHLARRKAVRASPGGHASEARAEAANRGPNDAAGTRRHVLRGHSGVGVPRNRSTTQAEMVRSGFATTSRVIAYRWGSPSRASSLSPW